MLAAMHLKEIGVPAQAAVPPLVEMATSPGRSSLHSEAAGALPTIDLSAARQVMTAWLPKLQDPDPQIRRDAVSVLGALGPLAKPAVPSLLGILDDPNSVVRDRVVRALGAISLPARTVMSRLLQALHDPEWTVRYAAVTQFSFSGFSSPESLAALQELTKDSNQTVARLAQSAVASADRQLQASTYLFMLNQGTNRTHALHQLAKLGPRAGETVSGIFPLLATHQPLERYLAACTLEEIGPSANAAIPALQQALHDRRHSMTTSPPSHRLTTFTLLIYWGCILLGLGIPWLATVAVDVLKHGQSLDQAWHQLRLHLFAPGYNLFLIGLMNAAPFLLFAVFALFHLGLAPPQDRRVCGRRGAGLLVTALGLVGLCAWTHVMTLWFPDAQGALAYFFLPFVLLGFMPVGYAVGRGVGALLFR
jgi:HEAT repeats